MIKKLSKALFSISLAVVSCGAGLMALVGGTGKASATGVEPLTATINGKIYSLEGKEYAKAGGGSEVFYIIDSAQDLSLVSYMVSVAKNTAWADKNFELANDIDLASRGWTAIGTEDNPFTGRFNGNGYTINGLNASKDACESEYFMHNESIVSPSNNAWYKDIGNDKYYIFEENRGYVNLEVKKLYNEVASDFTPTTFTNVSAHNKYYYGLFGKVMGDAEIADVVMGKSSYAYTNTSSEAVGNTYTGILAAYTEGTDANNKVSFYNIYDSMADADAKYGVPTEVYVNAVSGQYIADHTYYTYDEGTGAYSPVTGEEALNTPDTYYERMYKINTGLDTYYYRFFYHNSMVPNGIVYVYTEPNEENQPVAYLQCGQLNSSVVIGDKAYYYDYDTKTGILCLNLKERYTVNSGVVTSGETTTDTIVIDNVTYYLDPARTGTTANLYTTSALSTDAATVEQGNGYTTIAGKEYKYIYGADKVLKVLTYSDVCTLGYVGQYCGFFKGNYYRIGSVDYVGVGAISDNANYNGIINVAGVTYYYKIVFDVNANTSTLRFYEDPDIGYAKNFPASGNANGVGTISINGVVYTYIYDKEYKDLSLVSVSNALTNIPYTIAELNGDVSVENLEVGQIFSFNVSTPAGKTAARFYKKGTTSYISTFKMISGTTNQGLAVLDYNDSFVATTSALPKNHALTSEGNFYVVSDEPGYKLQYWTVPDENGNETIVKTNTDAENDDYNGLISYRVTSDVVAEAEKTYYTYNAATDIFTETAFATGVYERLTTGETSTNIENNNYQVDASWTTKNYTVYLKDTVLDTTSSPITVGYGMSWDKFIATNVSKAGYDLVGLYYYSNYNTESTGSIQNRIYGYHLIYDYDTKGNLANYSYVLTSDTQATAEKEYFYLTFNSGNEIYTKIENLEEGDSVPEGSYERVMNVPVHGACLSEGNTGVLLNMLFDNGNASENVYLYAKWQKQPVNGKISFTNTTDVYNKTQDTDIVSGKKYYTYDGIDYVLVANPTQANLGQYFEETNAFVAGKVTLENDAFTGVAASSFENGTDWFVKLSTDELATKFGIKFELNAGYKVKYLFPTDDGKIDTEDLTYYLWDDETDTLTKYEIHFIDGKVDTLRETPIETADIATGNWVNDTTWNNGGSQETPIAEVIYVDTSTSGQAIVYIYDSTESKLVKQTTLYKNGYDYSYINDAFSINSYKLWVDIEREEFDVDLTLWSDGIEEISANIKIIEDGIEKSSTDIGHGKEEPSVSYRFVDDRYHYYTMPIKVKYDSNYTITVEADQPYRIYDEEEGIAFRNNVNNSTTLSRLFTQGNGTVQGCFEALLYNDDGAGGVLTPTIEFKVVYSLFDITLEYEGADENFGSGTLPTARFAMSGDPGASTVFTFNAGENNGTFDDVTSYDGGIAFECPSNAYYIVNSIKADVYKLQGTIAHAVKDNEFTFVDETTYSSFGFRKINYVGNTYYVSASDIQTTGSTTQIDNAPYYTLVSYTSGIENSNFADSKNYVGGMIANGDKIVLKPVLAKHTYNVDIGSRFWNGAAIVDGVYGANGEVDASSVAEAIVNATTYAYKDTLTLSYSIDSHFYKFKEWQIVFTQDETTITSKIATKGDSEWSIQADFAGLSRLATATVNEDKIDLTFDQINTIFPRNIAIYGVFEGQTKTIAIDNTRAYILNYDGSGDNNLKSGLTSNIISNTSSMKKITYGTPKNEVLEFTMSNTDEFYVKGFAVYDNLNSKEVTVLYTYGEGKADGPMTLEGTYLTLFNDSEKLELLDDYFSGTSELHLIPVLEQKTINVVLEAGENADGETVTGGKYYAGGDGFDVSAYFDNMYFTKVGYTATGWASNVNADTPTDTFIKTQNNKIKFSASALAPQYGGGITLTRQYSPNTYTIRFAIDGKTTLNGTGFQTDATGSYMTATYDASVTLPTATKTGYTFNGWKLGGNTFTGATAYAYNTANGFAADDVTLTADFTPNNYNVKLEANKGSVASQTISMTYDTNIVSNLESLGTPTRDGYTFAGWYILGSYTTYGSFKGLAITADTVFSATLRDDSDTMDLVNLNNAENVMTILPMWTRVADYYTFTAAGSDQTATYTGSEQIFNAIEDVTAGGSSISGLLTGSEVTLVNGDKITYAWVKGGSSYTTKTSFKNVKLTDVAESGSFTLTLTIADTAVTMAAPVYFTKTINVTINPLVIEYTNLATSYEGQYARTSGAECADVAGGLNIGLDFETLALNNSNIEVYGYEVGNLEGTTFTPGINVGTYNTIKFKFTFKPGHIYVDGNYAGVGSEGGGRYYFYQTKSVTIAPRDITLTPDLKQLVFTGGAQDIHFVQTTTLNGQQITLTATGTLNAGYYGVAGSNETYTFANAIGSYNEGSRKIEGDVDDLENFNFVLLGEEELTIYGENAKQYNFVGNYVTKADNSSNFGSQTLIENKAISVTSVTIGEMIVSLADTNNFKMVSYEGGNTYVLDKNAGNKIVLQLNNNATEIHLYAIAEHGLANIVFAGENATYEKDSTTYHLFGIYQEGNQFTNELNAYTTPTTEFSGTALSAGTGTNILGYTDVMKLVINGLGEDGTEVETKYVKPGEITFSYARGGYGFAGWDIKSEDNERFAVNAVNLQNVTIGAQSGINPIEVTALWDAKQIVITDVQNIAESAFEGDRTITLNDIIGATSLQSKLAAEDYNVSWTYTLTWKQGETVLGSWTEQNGTLNGESSFSLPANTDSNGTYALLIENSAGAPSTTVEFTVAFATVELNIDTTTRTFTYSNGKDYKNDIDIEVPNSTKENKIYDLENSLSASANIWFAISPNETLTNVGTYTVTLNAKPNIYSVGANNSFDVVINKASVELSDSSLKTILGVSTETAITKTFGDDNGNLTITIKASSGNVFGTTSGNEPVTLTFYNPDVAGLGSSETGTGVLPDIYNLTNVQYESANFDFTISATDPVRLKVETNAAGLTIRIKAEATGFTYGEHTITTLTPVYESGSWVLKAKDAALNIVTTIALEDFTYGTTTVQATDSTFDLEKYTFTVDEIKDAKAYNTKSITVVALTGAPVGGEISFAGTTFLTVAKKALTITGVEKNWDGNNAFSTENGGTSATTDLVYGDTLTVTATFENNKGGEGIAVSNVAISGEKAANYALQSTETTGTILKNTEEITVSLKDYLGIVSGKVPYGITKSTIEAICAGTHNADLFNISTATHADILNIFTKDFIGISNIVVKKNDTAITDANYSTGNNLKVGTYTISFDLTSTSFTVGEMTPLEFEVEKNVVTLTHDEIKKFYDGNTTIKQTISTSFLSGDVLGVSASYSSADVGEDIALNIALTGADAENYELPTLPTGKIEARDTINFKLISKTTDLGGEFVADSKMPNDGGVYTVSGQNLACTLTGYGSSLTGEGAMAFLPNPTRIGYTFAGFYKEETFENVVNAENILGFINENLQSESYSGEIQLFAKWIKNSWNVTVSAGEHTAITPNETRTFAYYDEVSFSVECIGYNYAVSFTNGASEITPVGYVASGNNYSFLMADSDVVIVTNITGAISYAITYYLNSGEIVGTRPGQHVFGSETTVPNPTRTGYTFAGWNVLSGIVELSNVTDLTLGATEYTADISLSANWTANTYKIYFDLGNGVGDEEVFFEESVIAGLTEETDGAHAGKYYIVATFAEAFPILPTATKAAHTNCVWNIVGGGQIPATYNVADNLVVTPTFDVEAYTLTFNLTNTTIVLKDSLGSTINPTSTTDGTVIYADVIGGTDYSITATSNAGYNLNNWEIGGVTITGNSGTISYLKENMTFAIGSTARTNTITLSMNDYDKAKIDISVKVDGLDAFIDDTQTGKIFFTAPTDANVKMTISAKAGYTLNNFVDGHTGFTITAGESDEYTISGFTTDIGIIITLTANTYTATFKQDSVFKAVTGITNKLSGSPYIERTDGEENVYWAKEDVQTGSYLRFVPIMKPGYRFDGIKIDGVTYSLVPGEERRYNDPGTGIGIIINDIAEDTYYGCVTIDSFTDAFEVEFVAAKQQYSVTLGAYALNTENEIITTSGIALQIDDVDYDPANNKFDYQSQIKLSSSTTTVGYRFVGWTANATETDNVVSYTILSEDDEFEFTLQDNNVTLWAIYEISYVDVILTTKTNDVEANKGGHIKDANGIEVLNASILLNETVSYSVSVQKGYQFIGWVLIEDVEGSPVESPATTLEEYTLDGTTISFKVTRPINLCAKIEAKQFNIDITKALLVSGVATYPDDITYGNVQWGTYENGVFTADPGDQTVIAARTDEDVYIKIASEAGYFIDNISSTGTASFSYEILLGNEDRATERIYKISGLNADNGRYALLTRFYSNETSIVFNYVTSSGAILANAGQAEVVGVSGISVSGNRTSRVTIDAGTNSTVVIRAYVRLGYKIALDRIDPINPVVLYTKTGAWSGTLSVSVSPVEAKDASLGFSQLVTFTISGFEGGNVAINLQLDSAMYNVILHGKDAVQIGNIQQVNGGELIVLDNTTKAAIQDMEQIEGYSLLGFYTYANGTGSMYVDAQGQGSLPFNDNGYYWNGKAYVAAPYYVPETAYSLGTFNLWAVYKIDKTAITVVASPKGLEDFVATKKAQEFIGNLNQANSWQGDTAGVPFYAEVLYGANISASAPYFDGYVFGFWEINKTNAQGEKFVEYNTNEKITKLEHDGYTDMNLAAIYYVKTQVAATNGGSAVVKGYEYVINGAGTNYSRLEKESTGMYYFSTYKDDTITYVAIPRLGYDFIGWYDETDTCITTDANYVLPKIGNTINPANLTAKFEGKQKTIKLTVPASTSIGQIVKVSRYGGEFGIEEIAINPWTEFDVKVGEQIMFDFQINSTEYEANWSVGSVYNVFGGEYRRYVYEVDANDANEEGIINLNVDYQTRPFVFRVNYSLENGTEMELALAGTVEYVPTQNNFVEIRNGYQGTTIYSRAIYLKVTPRKNYQVSSIVVDGETLAGDYTYGGLINISTSKYEYEYQQSVEIEITFKRLLWADQLATQYQLEGSGTDENPYKITSAEDLAFVAKKIKEGDTVYASAAYELMKDIDLTGKYWSPIGTAINPFTGSFDFNVYDISGISVEYGYSGQTSHKGVFGTTLGANIFRTESNIGLILGIIGGAIGAIGITVGIFLGLRAKKKRELDKLANS